MPIFLYLIGNEINVLKFTCFCLALLCSACNSSEGEKELLYKHEYSIFQSFEYEYRDAVHDRPIIIAVNALGTGYTVIGFPIKNQNHGYEFVLADSKDPSKANSVPNVDFIVTPDTLSEAKKYALSKELENELISKVSDVFPK